MSSTIVHQKAYFCDAKDGEPSLFLYYVNENHPLANDDENYSPANGDEKYSPANSDKNYSPANGYDNCSPAKDSEPSLSIYCVNENHSSANDDENYSPANDNENNSSENDNEDYSPANDYESHSLAKRCDVTQKTKGMQQPFFCCICQEGFPTEAALKVHDLSHSAPYICGTCHMQFLEMENLKIHVAAHAEKRVHACDKCGKTFPTMNKWKMHLLAVHSEERPFTCALCKRGFTHMHGLKQHCLQHTVLPVGDPGLDSDVFLPRRRKRGLPRSPPKFCPRKPKEDPKEHPKVTKKDPKEHPRVTKKDPKEPPRVTKKAVKPCFWDNLRKGFSKNYLKDRRQAQEKKSNFIKIEVE